MFVVNSIVWPQAPNGKEMHYKDKDVSGDASDEDSPLCTSNAIFQSDIGSWFIVFGWGAKFVP